MKSIEITVSVGLCGCDRTDTIEVDDDADEEEISEDVKEAVLGGGMVTWSWQEVTASPKRRRR